MSTKNLNFSLHEEWETHGQSIFLTKDYEAFRAYFLESVGELQGLKSGPERGGIGSVIELAMAKQVYKKVDHFMTWLFGVLQKFWQF